MKHGNIVVQQLKPHIDLRGHVHAVLADGVVCLGRGLQSQAIDVQLVPGPNDVKAFVPQFAGIQNRAAADKAPAIKVVSVKSLPKNSDPSARDRNHDVGKSMVAMSNATSNVMDRLGRWRPIKRHQVARAWVAFHQGTLDTSPSVLLHATAALLLYFLSYAARQFVLRPYESCAPANSARRDSDHRA